MVGAGEGGVKWNGQVGGWGVRDLRGGLRIIEEVANGRTPLWIPGFLDSRYEHVLVLYVGIRRFPGRTDGGHEPGTR